jgi:hypothetical protein
MFCLLSFSNFRVRTSIIISSLFYIGLAELALWSSASHSTLGDRLLIRDGLVSVDTVSER